MSWQVSAVNEGGKTEGVRKPILRVVKIEGKKVSSVRVHVEGRGLVQSLSNDPRGGGGSRLLWTKRFQLEKKLLASTPHPIHY